MKRADQVACGTKRVLLVDDNKNGTPARKFALAEQGYEVDSAISGEEALQLFQESAYDLVVTDYRMPKMNGVELLTALRQLQPALPVVILSGFAEAGGLTEASTGANTVLQKGSTECQHLVRAVNRILYQRATRKPAAKKVANPPATNSPATKRK
jgi:CheY-like chemotaxis protein